jgi:hypothetical protein
VWRCCLGCSSTSPSSAASPRSSSCTSAPLLLQRKGTTVDGKPAEKNKPVQLQNQSVIVLGDSPHALTFLDKPGAVRLLPPLLLPPLLPLLCAATR